MTKNIQSKIFFPDQEEEKLSIEATTQLAIAAHQDDIEIMAINGILECFDNPNEFFSGVVMTDGRSSPRSGIYSSLHDDEMTQIRYQEQIKAAIVGNYKSLTSLGYTSSQVKEMNYHQPTNDIQQILELAHPRVVYTHNLADKHPTHIAVGIRVINSIRQIKKTIRPKKLYGCEVWRDLDWMPDSRKIAFDCSKHVNLQESLLGIYDSQITGGKRYDLATMGRRLANATFFESHETDQATHLAFAMDLSPLIHDDTMDIVKYIYNEIDIFKNETTDLLNLIMNN